MGAGVPGPSEKAMNAACTWSQRSTRFKMHTWAPPPAPDLPYRLRFLPPALLSPPQPCSPHPHLLEGTLERGDQTGTEPGREPRMCT